MKQKSRKMQRIDDITTWLSVCRTCHNWIELNPIDAQELKFSIKRI